jgi:hypothetical protein
MTASVHISPAEIQIPAGAMIWRGVGGVNEEASER